METKLKTTRTNKPTGLVTLRKWVISFKNKIGPTRYLYIVAGLIGLCAGIAAVTLKSSVHGAEELARYLVGKTEYPWLLSVLPCLGIGLSFLWVKYYVKDDISHGISGVLDVIASPAQKIKPHNMYTSLVGCIITAGLGGSVGMEGPIVATGAALGDNIASLSSADYKRRMILIGCGAAAAISAIFKAPIAGLVFSVELFAVNAAGSSIIALLISSAVGCLFSMVVSGYQVEFRFTVHDHFSPANVPYYLVLGAVMAFASVYFMRAARAMDSFVKRVPAGLARIALGGLSVGALIFLFPPLYGEGYYAMRSMLTDKMAELFSNSLFFGLSNNALFLPLLLIVLALVKPLATAFTTSSGGVGGTFAPTLFVGCVTGYAFAALINLSGIAHLPEMNFALAGMAGAISGVMHAPLTGIFLIAELTGGYELFIPLIIVSCLSTVITRQFEPYSIYTRPLAMRGKLITHHKDQAVLTLLQIKDFVELDRPIIWADSNMDELTQVITSAPRDYYPVEERGGKFLGFIDMKDVMPVLINPELKDFFLLSDLIHNPRRYLEASMGMNEILDEFKESNELELPVFEKGSLLGFVSRAIIYAAYRDKLAEISDGDES